MGRNLARNFARHGYTVAVHNRTAGQDRRAGRGVRRRGQLRAGVVDRGVRGRAWSARAGSSSWSRPAPPTDAVIDELVPLLEPGDIIIDGGNAHFADTRRREAALREQGLHFVGTGVSGGEEGALNGPEHHARRLARVVRRARPDAGERSPPRSTASPCCTHIGPDGAGHFVKMVHNGIEYADMQLIAEAYDLLRGAGLDDPAQIAEIFAELEQRRPRVVPDRDHRRGAAPGRRRRPASRSSTSCSTRPSRRAPAAGPCRPRSTSGVPVTGIAEAVFARSLSGHADLRVGGGRHPARPGRPVGGGRDQLRRRRPRGAVRLQDRRLRPGLRR